MTTTTTDALERFYNDVVEGTGMDVLLYSDWNWMTRERPLYMTVRITTHHSTLGKWTYVQNVSEDFAEDSALAGPYVAKEAVRVYAKQTAKKPVGRR